MDPDSQDSVADGTWVDLPQRPSPNHGPRPGGGQDLDAIVLHHTATTDLAAALAIFRDPARELSAHFLVDRDGLVVQCVPLARRAWHAGVSTFAGRDNVNDFSAGIEIVNLGDGVDPYPEAQVQAVTHLLARLCTSLGIPPHRITTHRQVALPPGRKTDPSSNFPLEAVLAGVARLTSRQ